MTFDELLAMQKPSVAHFMEQLTERAGTSDADAKILVEAGEMMCELLDKQGEVPKDCREDYVNHPPHYRTKREGDGRYNEAIDLIEDYGFGPGFWLGNACKYIIRWESKGSLQDLRKAKWYLRRAYNRSDEVSLFSTNNPSRRTLMPAELQKEFPQLPLALCKVLHFILSVMTSDMTSGHIKDQLWHSIAGITSFILSKELEEYNAEADGAER